MTYQAILPVSLFDRLQQVRGRYAAALAAASKGDYSSASDLRAVSRYLGQMLAREAKKGPEARGGLRMLDLSLEVDRLFPELRGWTQHELLERHRRRMLAQAGPKQVAV